MGERDKEREIDKHRMKDTDTEIEREMRNM